MASKAGELDSATELADVDEEDDLRLTDVNTSACTSWEGLSERLGCRLPVRELEGELSAVDTGWATVVLGKEDTEVRLWCSLLVRGVAWPEWRPEVLENPDVGDRGEIGIELTIDMLLEWWP